MRWYLPKQTFIMPALRIFVVYLDSLLITKAFSEKSYFLSAKRSLVNRIKKKLKDTFEGKGVHYNIY